MRKQFYLAITIILIHLAQLTSAQTNYINHTLKQGESLSVLAGQYNTNVGDIMRINGMHANTKLVYGSVIKIPSANKQVTPQPAQPTETSSNILTHKVVKGETLYSISKQYNISVTDLTAWNHLNNNAAKLGSVLIVGNNNAVAVNNPASNTKKQHVETNAQMQPVTNQPQQEQTAGLNNTITDTSSAKPFENNASANIQNSVADSAEVKANDITTNATSNNASAAVSQNGEGYFADSFKKSRKQQHVSGVSKTFKTASGWNDGKFYVLADDINPGTIVKLTADNGNVVYAKVLWNMGDLKENNGINFRISNATAAALNENTDAFNLNIYY